MIKMQRENAFVVNSKTHLFTFIKLSSFQDNISKGQ